MMYHFPLIPTGEAVRMKLQ